MGEWFHKIYILTILSYFIIPNISLLGLIVQSSLIPFPNLESNEFRFLISGVYSWTSHFPHVTLDRTRSQKPPYLLCFRRYVRKMYSSNKLSLEMVISIFNKVFEKWLIKSRWVFEGHLINVANGLIRKHLILRIWTCILAFCLQITFSFKNNRMWIVSRLV